ncbi:hypothetical protein BDV3_001539 [Batrachochytrium dendrobatidis]|nr:hypothetical protein BDEG_21067 [Batrachochytrium dendrobatidis JEL423]
MSIRPFSSVKMLASRSFQSPISSFNRPYMPSRYLLSKAQTRIFHSDTPKWSLSQSPYHILKSTQSSSKQDLKDRFIELTKQYHPDKTLNMPEEERQRRHTHYLHIQAAYKLLRDPKTRQMYDLGQITYNPNKSNSYTTFGGNIITPSVKDFIYPWVLGVAFLGIMSLIWIDNNNSARIREEEIAWQYFRQQRRKEGLGDIVGMTHYRRV